MPPRVAQRLLQGKPLLFVGGQGHRVRHRASSVAGLGARSPIGTSLYGDSGGGHGSELRPPCSSSLADQGWGSQALEVLVWCR